MRRTRLRLRVFEESGSECELMIIQRVGML